MDPQWAAPPAADECLVSSYVSRGQKGGTFIDESVLDLATHEARMLDHGSYRPAQCLCGWRTLHIHGVRERKPRGMVTSDGGLAVIWVAVFLCARCLASWRVVPAFLARCLWRTWAAVEKTVLSKETPGEAEVPQRTQQRWRARLAQAARAPVQSLATSGSTMLRGVAQAVGLEGTREQLVEGYAATFAGTALTTLATLLHRLSPGIRLM